MVKDSLKAINKALAKQEKKRKKLVDKKKKLKVHYDKKRDVYKVKMKGKTYLLKMKEPVRKLRTRKAKDALKEHLKNLSKTKAAPVGQVAPPEHSGNSLPATRLQQNPKALRSNATNHEVILKKNSQNVSPMASPDALAIPDAQAKYQMFAGYNQAEQTGQKELQTATEETQKAKAAQAAAEEQLRSHRAAPQLPALPPVEYAGTPAAGIRKRLPFYKSPENNNKNTATGVVLQEDVIIPPMPDLDTTDENSIKLYDRFFTGLPDSVKAIVRTEVFGDANRTKLRTATTKGFKDWAVTFFANGVDGRSKLPTTKYFKDGTVIIPPRNAEIATMSAFFGNLKDVYIQFLIVSAILHGKDVRFKENIKAYMDANTDQSMQNVINAYLGNHAYKNHERLKINLKVHRGQGKNEVEGDGLSSGDIMNVMKDSKAFRGVYPVDLIKDINLLKKKPSSAIINTDVAAGKGLHWVGVYCDPLKRTFEYYDPFGEPPTMEMSADFAHLIKGKFKPSRNGFQMKNNLIREQDNKSDTCGVHAMRFITRREQGVPFKQSTPYFKSMEKDAQDDIEKIRALPKFGYVNKK